jgi:hypothetical protein
MFWDLCCGQWPDQVEYLHEEPLVDFMGQPIPLTAL